MDIFAKAAPAADNNPVLVPMNPGYNTCVGARYVPKFVNPPTYQWDKTLAYEPLSIVLYQGNSYTSVGFVPVGAEITDTQYWALTGNFNAQLANVLNNLNDLQSTVNTNTSDITTASRNMRSANILMKKRHYLILGDFWSMVNGDINPWWTVFKSFVSPAVVECIAQETTNFYDGQWQALMDSYTGNASDVDEVLIVGGGGDQGHSGNTLYTPASTFFKNARTKFPNAHFTMVFLTYPDDSVLNYLTYRAISSLNKVTFIPGGVVYNVNSSTYWTADHKPTSTTQTLTYELVIQNMLMNSNSLGHWQAGALGINGGNSTIEFNASSYGHYKVLDLRPGEITWNTPFKTGSPKQIGRVQLYQIHPQPGYDTITGTCICNSGSDRFAAAYEISFYPDSQSSSIPVTLNLIRLDQSGVFDVNTASFSFNQLVYGDGFM